MMTVGPWFLRTKRAIDIAICVLISPLVLIVLAACAIAIRIDSPGAVLFTQQRTGRNGVRFAMYKFRTMVHNAEELKPSLQHLNILPPPDFKIPNDPRITGVGKFLRKTSLDELPQILNVLRGEMCSGRTAPDVVPRQHVQPVAHRAVGGHSGHHRPVAGRWPKPDDLRRA